VIKVICTDHWSGQAVPSIYLLFWLRGSIFFNHGGISS